MTISNEIINVLNYLGSKFGIAIDWTSANVIPYVQELIGKYISWEIATSIAWGVVGLIVIVFAIFLIVLDKINDFDGLGYLFGGFLLLVGFFTIGTQLFDILKCTYFPEMQVLEFAKSLLPNT